MWVWEDMADCHSEFGHNHAQPPSHVEHGTSTSWTSACLECRMAPSPHSPTLSRRPPFPPLPPLAPSQHSPPPFHPRHPLRPHHIHPPFLAAHPFHPCHPLRPRNIHHPLSTLATPCALTTFTHPFHPHHHLPPTPCATCSQDIAASS